MNISKYHQQGTMTLLMSLVILTLITFVSLYTAHTVSMEQKISANDYRSRQAFEAAEAGMEAAMSYIDTEVDRDQDGFADSNMFVAATNTLAVEGSMGDTNAIVLDNGASVTVTVVDLLDDPTTAGINEGETLQIYVQSVGVSADGSATRTITLMVPTIVPVPNTPENPVITRNAMVIGGSATVHNPEGHSTLWSGGDIDMGSNAATKTEIASPLDGDYPDCLGGKNKHGDGTTVKCGMIATSSNFATGLDVVEHDSNLANLTADQFFENFFGMSPAEYKENMIDYEVAGANFDNDWDDSPQGVGEAAYKKIWVDGDVTAQGGTVGCTATVNNQKSDEDELNCQSSGGLLKPSIVIIDGDLTLSGQPKFFGLVFVTGNITLTGSTEVQGAMVVAGTVTSSGGGSLDAWYDSQVLRDLAKGAGDRTGASGTWRDF